MTVPNNDQLEQLDIKLADLGGLDLTSSRQLLTTLGSVIAFVSATGAGQHLGLNGNERLASLILFGALISVYVLGKSIHHAAIEHGNAAVKVAAINAAASTSTSVVLDSPPDAQTVGADPATEPDPLDVPQPPAVGGDFPIETASTTLSDETAVPAASDSPVV